MCIRPTPPEVQAVIKVETYDFHAAVDELLTFITSTTIHNTHIFLRELLANASNALDEIRYQNLSDASKLDAQEQLRIHIAANKDAKTLTIWDTGIGMTKDDLINKLGAAATSGTMAFHKASLSGADNSMNAHFGVGFYTAYLVAEKVAVITKNNGDEQYMWESTGSGSFTVKPDHGEPLGRGTKIILHLKEDQTDYLEACKITEVVKKYSRFIAYPIELSVETEIHEDTSEDEEDTKDEKNDDRPMIEDLGEDEKVSKEKDQMEMNSKEQYRVYERLDKTRPLWTRSPENILQKDYEGFYMSMAKDWEEPLATKHFYMHGHLGCHVLLYVPKRAPRNMFVNKKNFHLYACSVFIMDDCEVLVPEYLNFMKGVIDIDCLPLNVTRDMLQQSSIMKAISKNLVDNCLELFEELTEDKDKYNQFYRQFSKKLKLGIFDDSTNKKRLAHLFRYQSSMSGTAMTSLKDYVTRMRHGQKDIYYITEKFNKQIEHSTYVERVHKSGYEVLYMVDAVDEFIVQHLKEYDGKKLVDITREGLELPCTDEKKFEKEEDKYERLCVFMKADLGKQAVKKEDG